MIGDFTSKFPGVAITKNDVGAVRSDARVSEPTFNRGPFKIGRLRRHQLIERDVSEEREIALRNPKTVCVKGKLAEPVKTTE